MEDLLTVAELCAWLKVTSKTIYRWRKLGNFPEPVKLEVLRFRRKDVEEWMRKSA